MSTTLITILGKGRDNPLTGYREATYQFDEQTKLKTPFFGLALAEHLKPKTLVILGTAGSMWGVLIEHFANHDHNETLRLELMDTESQGAVTQNLLDRVTPLLQESIAHEVVLRLIPNGKSDEEQIGILQVIADTLGKQQTNIHIDITHGFRHLAIIGFLSAAMLERLRTQLNIEALWYGALDMTQAGNTPVIRLDGLNAVQQWVSALDRFDANGNYGVFAPLLEADGLPTDKVRCLVDAAFYETTTQIANAARSLQTLLPLLDTPLKGASNLFQAQLKQKLQWAQGDNLAKQQHLLAQRALKRGDYLRVCILGLEAIITRYCLTEQLDYNQPKPRETAVEKIQKAIKNKELAEWQSKSYQMLNTLRNSMAHGTKPTYQPAEALIKNRERLPKELETLLGQIGTHLHG